MCEFRLRKCSVVGNFVAGDRLYRGPERLWKNRFVPCAPDYNFVANELECTTDCGKSLVKSILSQPSEFAQGQFNWTEPASWFCACALASDIFIFSAVPSLSELTQDNASPLV